MDESSSDLTSRILGTWRMLTWKRVLKETGEESDAFGPDPFGYINYAPDGVSGKPTASLIDYPIRLVEVRAQRRWRRSAASTAAA